MLELFFQYVDRYPALVKTVSHYKRRLIRQLISRRFLGGKRFGPMCWELTQSVSIQGDDAWCLFSDFFDGPVYVFVDQFYNNMSHHCFIFREVTMINDLHIEYEYWPEEIAIVDSKITRFAVNWHESSLVLAGGAMDKAAMMGGYDSRENYGRIKDLNNENDRRLVENLLAISLDIRLESPFTMRPLTLEWAIERSSRFDVFVHGLSRFCEPQAQVSVPQILEGPYIKSDSVIQVVHESMPGFWEWSVPVRCLGQVVRRLQVESEQVYLVSQADDFFAVIDKDQRATIMRRITR